MYVELKFLTNFSSIDYFCHILKWKDACCNHLVKELILVKFKVVVEKGFQARSAWLLDKKLPYDGQDKSLGGGGSSPLQDDGNRAGEKPRSAP
jgi:hypothetical protein